MKNTKVDNSSIFNEQKTDLITILENDMNNREDFHEKMFIKYLLNQKMETKDDLRRIIFAYNNGELLSYKDLYVYDKQYEHIFLKKNFNFVRHVINFIFLFTPFSFILYKTINMSKKNIIVLPLGIVLALLTGIFFGIAGNSFNIWLANYGGLDKSDERVVSERTKRKIGIGAGIVSVFSIGKNVKNGIKDIADVDRWKEMK